MRVIPADMLRDAIGRLDLVDALRDAFRGHQRPACPHDLQRCSTSTTAMFACAGLRDCSSAASGFANVMLISVLERRSEIGLRRALGATRRHVGVQFLAESLLLAAAGGLAGVLLGALVTACYAANQGRQALVPPLAIGGGLVAAAAIAASPASTRRCARHAYRPRTPCGRRERRLVQLPSQRRSAPPGASSHPNVAATDPCPRRPRPQPLTNERRSVMRNQRDPVTASLERTYPRDVYPLRGVIDIRAPIRRKVP